MKNNLILILIISVPMISLADDTIKFDTSLLDAQDRKNVDLSEFKKPGYIMPGTYSMMISVNDNPISEQKIIYNKSNKNGENEPCISKNIVSLIGLKDEVKKNLKWEKGNKCLDLKSINGIITRGDLSTNTFNIEIPKELLEYASNDWDPPSRWDNGIAGVLFDYNLNSQVVRNKDENLQSSLTGNGTVGANYEAWRLRSYWQGQYYKDNMKSESNFHNIDFYRIYAYRLIDKLKAKLTLGESYLNSSVFDTFNFAGAQLTTEDNMVPPELRGYAPEVSGLAKTNAKVTIYQDSNVIYESQVAPGIFHITDLSTNGTGKLDVVVHEQDGTIHKFQVNATSKPYLTRPGRLSYKISAGEASRGTNFLSGPMFSHGEFSWGFNNALSLFGGVILSNVYKALSLGIGRDLSSLGAISLDLTHSNATIHNDQNLSGDSVRINYTKSFHDYDSSITFAGYRFSDKNFMTMSQLLNSAGESSDINAIKSKQLYTVNIDKNFKDYGINTSLTLNHEEYWGKRNPSNYYRASIRKYFDLDFLQKVSIDLSFFIRSFSGYKDRGAYVNISLPLSGDGRASYSAQASIFGISNSIGYSNKINQNDSYQINTDIKNNINAFYSHKANYFEFTGSASHTNDSYDSLGLSFKGGATLTPEGGAFHRQNIAGGSRILIDTNGASNIPVQGYGPAVKSNFFGKAVIDNVNNGDKSTVKVDINKLPENAFVNHSVYQTTLSEGAIGYHKLDIISGWKMMAIIKKQDGTYPPLGATVLNAENQQLGIVDDNGSVWLIGLLPNEMINVEWNGIDRCQAKIPYNLKNSLKGPLLLTCKK